MPLDPKTVFVSQSTLEANGGRADFVETRMRQYFGVERVHYLMALPGETIEHLDFIVQAVAPNTLLIAAPPDFDDRGRPVRQQLQRELRRRLTENRAYLRREFPKLRLIEVAMPDPVFPSDEAVVQQLFAEAAYTVAQQMGLASAEMSRLPLGAGAQEKLANRLRQTGVVSSFEGLENQARVVSAVFQRSIEELLNERAQPYTYYRSYLNSLLVRGVDGERILVPRFRSSSPEVQLRLNAMEDEVESAYRMALPDTELVWIDCTSLTFKMGTIHCLATVLPSLSEIGVRPAR